MADLIDREALLKNALLRVEGNWELHGKIVPFSAIPEQYIKDAPAVDAEPVRHGYWKATFAGSAICSVCGEDQEIETFVGNAVQKYCARCGAKMDAKDESEGDKTP